MDFEVKRLTCAGLDVHKKSVAAAICITNPVTLEATYKTKVFSTSNSDIAARREWLLTHPKYVRAIKGKKTDKRDAKWIANLFRFDIVRASFIPPPTKEVAPTITVAPVPYWCASSFPPIVKPKSFLNFSTGNSCIF
ncbi:MAG: hypothetical protein RR678_11375 [Lachnospiraceae bacterium]